MLGTHVQKVSVTFCPDAACPEADDAAEDAPAAGGADEELPEDEQPAATSAASTTLASTGPVFATARLRRRLVVSFMGPSAVRDRR
jgi:hypothetical protein